MFSAPSADGLIGDSDSSLKQHFLNVAQAERKPVIEPDSAGDDFWWKAMVLVIGDGLVHAMINIDYSLNPKQGDNTGIPHWNIDKDLDELAAYSCRARQWLSSVYTHRRDKFCHPAIPCFPTICGIVFHPGKLQPFRPLFGCWRGYQVSIGSWRGSLAFIRRIA